MSHLPILVFLKSMTNQKFCVNYFDQVNEQLTNSSIINKNCIDKRLKFNSLSLFHQNIQSLNNKTLRLEVELSLLESDIVCFTEHWQSKLELNEIILSNYTLLASFCRQKNMHGGSAIYVKNNNDLFKAVNCDKLCVLGKFECCGIVSSKLEIFIFVIYCPSPCDIDVFIDYMEEIFNFTQNSNNKVLIVGDINIDFLTKDKASRSYWILWL